MLEGKGDALGTRTMRNNASWSTNQVVRVPSIRPGLSLWLFLIESIR